MNLACMCVCVCESDVFLLYEMKDEIPLFECDVYSVAIYAYFIDVLSFNDADHYTRIFCSTLNRVRQKYKRKKKHSKYNAYSYGNCVYARCFPCCLSLSYAVFCRIRFFSFVCLAKCVCHFCCHTKFRYVLINVMRVAFSIIHIFIHNKSMQIALIRARARFGRVSGI